MLKTHVITSLLISLFSILSPTQASTWYGFCYGRISGEVVCSPIKVKTATFSNDCKKWAQDQDATSWGNHTATTEKQLKDKQAVKCDKVEGAPTLPPLSPIPPISPFPLPPIGGTYECQGVRTCPSADGMSSSQTMDIYGTVFALTKSKAISLCIKTYSDQYLSDLEEAAKMELCQYRVEVRKD